ncbi:MAG: EF-P beta-lysylation protein EpmB [Acidobacteriota bacterium]
MITRTSSPQPTLKPPRAVGPERHTKDVVPAWQRSLSQAVRTVSELTDLLGLGPEVGTAAAGEDFPLRVPRGYVDRMRREDPHDPLLLQVLPTAAELRTTPGYSHDPLGERQAAAAPGVLHKYRGRALLLVTAACAVHCRYCFRRHFPYAEHRLSGEQLDRALRYLADQPSLSEIILSGGDPLSLSDDKLGRLAASLAEIPHLERLRIHTRLPIVLPERVDHNLLEWLTGNRLRPVVVLHANHPQEIDRAVHQAIARLKRADILVLNQTVLLAGVNDDAKVLGRLSEALFSAGVLPYYLHLMDRVEGAAHFEVDADSARRIVGQMMRELPGYLVPKLVQEVAGAPSKLPVSPLGAGEAG